ncbi:MAG TPA: PQQ-binding-like beta-propeller repeat protein [Oligoflexus sp.]|uniref:outer membrane protein assembly factor BamB family protein n=1 Tax=Oligoflexus sp. TaxID=1971216 RepID=UPI002D6DE3FF|nr:PQQ-binding-like beta-propeller repeat protein [Oligoflexus sp.]HYX37706.1 PQQ-binding-like beta-propeller repeat protein [Oligoflexus sp.]
MLSQAFMQTRVWILIFVGLLPAGLLAQTLDLLSEKQAWTGDHVLAGPWEVKEWGSFGSPSLKADVDLKPGVFYSLKIHQDRDLSRFDWISALVTRSWWGDFGDMLQARIYIKTGSNWQWHEGLAVQVAPSFSQFYYAHNTVLDFDLRQIPQRDQVKEIGVQFVSGANASGQGAVYLGQFKLTAQTKGQAFPQWVRPQTSTADGFGRYFSVESQRLAAIDLKHGSSKWTQSFPTPVKIYFPETVSNEAAYAVGADKIYSINRDTGRINWTKAIDRSSYVEIHTDTEHDIYLSVNSHDLKTIVALRKSDGATLWNVQGADSSSIEGEVSGRFYASQGVVTLVRKQDGYALTGIEKSSGRIVWTYSGEADSGFRLHPGKHGELLIAGGSEVLSSVSALEGHTGRPLWTYYNEKRIDVVAPDSAGKVLLRVYDTLIALDPQDGTLQWQHAAPGFFVLNLDGKGRAYLSSYGREGDTFTALGSNGQILWQHSTKNGSISFMNGFVFALEKEGAQARLSLLEPDTGRPRWTYNAQTDAAFMWTNNRDFIVIDGSHFTAMEPTSGRALWTYSTPLRANILQGDAHNIYIQEYDSNFNGPPLLRAIHRSTGQAVWKYQPVSGVAGLIMGSPSSSTTQGLVFFQYVVGSKFPITQGTLALPLE